MSSPIHGISLHRHRGARDSDHGFTLVELLVVVAIIGVLCGMIMPAIQSSRESARRVQCEARQMQIGMALEEYDLAHGHLPAGVEDEAGPIRNEPSGQHLAWTGRILAHLEEPTIAAALEERKSAYDKLLDAIRLETPSVYACPSVGLTEMHSEWQGQRLGLSSYAGVHHDVEAPIDEDQHGVLFRNSRITGDDIADGRAYTLMVGEKVASEELLDLGWLSGSRATLRNAGSRGLIGNSNAPDDAGPASGTDKKPKASADGKASAAERVLFVGSFDSYHPSGVVFTFADGSVRLLTRDVDPGLLQRLCHRFDGTRLELP